MGLLVPELFRQQLGQQFFQFGGLHRNEPLDQFRLGLLLKQPPGGTVQRSG